MDQVTTGAAAIATTDFSIITLFMRADLIVKSVIIILIVSSLYSWALIFEKLKIFKKINLTILATIGSVAPFVGLFGTVWGIMNSFQSIAISRNTSLAIVAPGIAEALFATALGLLAAIPAVVAYNRYSNSSRLYTQKLENFSRSFLTII